MYYVNNRTTVSATQCKEIRLSCLFKIAYLSLVVADDAWLAIRGRVYNVTHYLPYHPGGKDISLFNYVDCENKTYLQRGVGFYGY